MLIESIIFTPRIVPGPPTNVEVIANLEDGSLQVTWGPPTNPSGTLISYQVVVTNLGTMFQCPRIVTFYFVF